MALHTRLLPRGFKFSLAESKGITLAEAPKKAQAVIQAMEICAGHDFV